MNRERGALDTMLIVAIVALAALALGTWGVYEFGYSRGKANEAKAWQEEKAKLEADLANATAEAATKIDDMMAAYDAGKASAKTKYITIQAKGKTDVATYPVFNNPECVLPPDSLRNLQDARRGVRSAADPGPPAPTVPRPVVGAPR